MYIYIHTYIHIYIYIYIVGVMYIYIYTHMYVYVYGFSWIFHVWWHGMIMDGTSPISSHQSSIVFADPNRSDGVRRVIELRLQECQKMKQVQWTWFFSIYLFKIVSLDFLGPNHKSWMNTKHEQKAITWIQRVRLNMHHISTTHRRASLDTATILDVATWGLNVPTISRWNATLNG